MTKEYSAHPDLACEQLQRAELEAAALPTTTARNGGSPNQTQNYSSHIYHRRHNSGSGGSTSATATTQSPKRSKPNTSLSHTSSAKETCCLDALDAYKTSKVPNRTPTTVTTTMSMRIKSMLLIQLQYYLFIY